MRYLRWLWLDISAGQCSGFPLCCITFYVTGWKLLFGRNRQWLYDKPPWRVNAIQAYHRLSNNAGYVPCPLCLISGARVNIRKCDDKCGHKECCRRLIDEEDGI